MMTTAVMMMMALGSQVAELPKPGDLISGVLAKYADADSAVGSVTMTQIVQDKKHTIKTNFQLQRPSKVFIEQTSPTKAPNSWIVTSDGIKLSYAIPAKPGEKEVRLYEDIATRATTTGEPKVLKYNDILVAVRRSIGDNYNPFLNFTMQGKGDNLGLKGYIARFKSVNQKGEPAMKTRELKKLEDGTEVYVVSGLFQYGAPVEVQVRSGALNDPESIARMELWITKDFDLKRMKTIESLQVIPDGTNLPTQVNIVTTWDGNVQLNPTVNASLFTVR
jgi:hypothetical protein